MPHIIFVDVLNKIGCHLFSPGLGWHKTAPSIGLFFSVFSGSPHFLGGKKINLWGTFSKRGEKSSMHMVFNLLNASLRHSFVLSHMNGFNPGLYKMKWSPIETRFFIHKFLYIRILWCPLMRVKKLNWFLCVSFAGWWSSLERHRVMRGGSRGLIYGRKTWMGPRISS